MCDIETTGTHSGHNAMIQLAAVAYNYHTGAVGPAFCRNLMMPPGRWWDEDTRNWWASQKPEVFQRVTENPFPPGAVMQEFADWVRASTGALHQPRLWAKPATFEWPFLQSYFHQFDVTCPFHFRDVVDVQSFIRGLRRDPAAPAFDKEVPFEGDAHHALDDVFHQIRVVLTAKHKFTGEQVGSRDQDPAEVGGVPH